jgi:hypothetical protein
MMVGYAQITKKRTAKNAKDTKVRGFRDIFHFHPVHPLILVILIQMKYHLNPSFSTKQIFD